MKTTREELVAKIAQLEESNAQLANADEARRKEFGKAFGWTVTNAYTYNTYNNLPERKTPTWPEIFVKLGTLIAAKNFYDFEGNVSELETAVEEMQRLIDKPKP